MFFSLYWSFTACVARSSHAAWSCRGSPPAGGLELAEVFHLSRRGRSQSNCQSCGFPSQRSRYVRSDCAVTWAVMNLPLIQAVIPERSNFSDQTELSSISILEPRLQILYTHCLPFGLPLVVLIPERFRLPRYAPAPTAPRAEEPESALVDLARRSIICLIEVLQKRAE
jgi:hypothetical protein